MNSASRFGDGFYTTLWPFESHWWIPIDGSIALYKSLETLLQEINVHAR